MIAGEYDENYIYIIDGAVSINKGRENHWSLIRELMQIPAIKVIEHPDIFVSRTEYNIDDFDYIIELRNEPDEEITYKNFKNENLFGFHNFDL